MIEIYNFWNEITFLHLSQILMNVRKKLIIAQIMPYVSTMMVASHVIVQKVSLEMAFLVAVSS